LKPLGTDARLLGGGEASLSGRTMGGSVHEQLENFASSGDREFILSTDAAGRSAAHEWVEKHHSSWAHVSATVGGDRVLQITKGEGDTTAAASSITLECENVLEQLEEFAGSEHSMLDITGTAPADRSAAHEWVEKHADAAVRSWVHVSNTVDGVRVLQISKTAAVVGTRKKKSMADLRASTWAAGAGDSTKKKRVRKRGAKPDSELTPAELDRRNHQREKREEALARQKRGLPALPPSKRRRANHTMRKNHNHGDSKSGGERKQQKEAEAETRKAEYHAQLHAGE
jgi:hypothetical protein